ncbi:ankyrin repeat-containing domain protein [Nemania sp. FL0031]|nr:ankyrin repeat-containing domain protein [Nemania sp. FL0031]
MEIPESVPAFVPDGVSEGGIDQGYPRTTIFMIHGLAGPEPDDRVDCERTWLTWANAEYRSLTYSPSVIVGEETFESALEKEARNILEHILGSTAHDYEQLFMFWAHDIGGAIVKLALLIATREEKYRHIADRTHSVMFFGTPHRRSHKHDLNSVAPEIIYTCSNIVPGRSAFQMINTLAHQHEDIGRQFTDISYRFGIVNYYQSSASISTSSHKVIVPEDCATMGLETEVRIGRDYPHQYLPSFMSAAEAMVLQSHILNTKIALWTPFGKFIDLIFTCASQEAAPQVESQISIFSSAIFESWVTSEDLAPRYIALKLNGASERTDILRIAATTIQEQQQTPWVKYPALCYPEEGELNIYASLILQVLAQQPQSFMNISHLVPTVMDSIRSTNRVWAGRTLWGCLRTLIHSPTCVPTYGFIHIGSPTSVHVLDMLHSALQETESNFRLVLAPREDQYFHCEQLKPLVVDVEPSGSTWDTAEVGALEDPTAIRARLHDLVLEDPSLGHWVLCGLAWVAYAFRPLTLEELDVVLSLESHRLGTSPPSSRARFIELLPGIIECKLGRIILVDPKVPEIVLQLTKSLHVYDISPHARIAQTSLAFLVTCVIKDKDGNPIQLGERFISNREVPIVYPDFTEYAARYWPAHCRLAGVDDINSEDAFSNFVADKSNLRKWISLVEYFSQLTIPRQMCTDSMVESLGGYLDFKSFKGLEVLYNIIIRPSRLNSLERLLIYAAEHGDRNLLCRLYQNIESIGQSAVIRATAASRGALHDELIEHFARLRENDPTILTRIQLTAQAMGNREISDKILLNLPSIMPDSTRNEWLTEALEIAIENQDNEIITKLLERQDLVQHISSDRTSRWTVLHLAAHAGDLSIMSQLLNTDLRNIIDVISLENASPLIIASSRGFVSVARLLLSKEALPNLRGDDEKRALHFASQYGFCKTAEELLLKGSDVTAQDYEGDCPLHVAIRSRKIKLAELLVEAFPSIQIDVNEPPDEISHHFHSHDTEMSIDDELDETGHRSPDADVEMTIDNESGLRGIAAPIDRINDVGRTVLSEAAEQNLPSVVRHLLEKGADSTVLDDLSYTAIHLATKIGASEVIRMLITKSPVLDLQTEDSGCTPLHFCCYRGHLEAALQLMESGVDIYLRDGWNRTPLSAACAVGDLRLVKALLQKYDREEWPASLAEATKYGYYDVTEYLLDMGCPVNITTTHTTALLNASQFAQTKIVELLLLRGAEVEIADSSGQRAIHKAVQGKSHEVVRLLSDIGATLNVQDNDDDTPLSTAIYLKCPEIVAFLLERGAAMKLPRRWWRFRNLLDFSFHHSSEEVTKVLLRFYKQGKKDPSFTPIKGLLMAIDIGDEKFLDLVLDTWYGPDKTEDLSMGEAIYYAIHTERIKTLRKLLDHPLGSAATKYEVPKKGTVLHAAAYESTYAVVKLLLDKGADASIVSGRFGTALNVACAVGKTGTARILIRHMSTEDRNSKTGVYRTPMQSAIVGFQCEPSILQWEQKVAFLRYLKRKGVSPLVVGGTYSTPLHASLNLWLSVPDELVFWLFRNARPSVGYRDSAGRLPLHLAILKGKWNLASKILDLVEEPRVTQLSHKDRQGLSGLHYSVISKSPVPLTKILSIEWEENRTNEKDIDGWTPLHWACRQPGTNIVAALIEKGADVIAQTNEGWTPRQIAILHGNTDDEYVRMLPEIAEKGMDLPSTPRGKFDAECKVCGCTIFWKQYHCKSDDCENFDLCFKCFSHVEMIHFQGHEFEEKYDY